MSLSALGPAFLSRPTGLATDTGPAFAAPASVAPPGGASFADALSRMAGDTVGALRGAEARSAEALEGKADARQVVDAVMSAERSLQAAVSIRDKIVSAYLEVSRMAI